MKERMTFLVAAVFLLAAGGFLTSLLGGNAITDVLPFLQQSSDPEASTLSSEAWQIEQFFLLVGFIVVNMIGIGATIAALMYVLNRGVATAQAEAEQEGS